jgi:hypothetical protein
VTGLLGIAKHERVRGRGEVKITTRINDGNHEHERGQSRIRRRYILASTHPHYWTENLETRIRITLFFHVSWHDLLTCFPWHPWTVQNP